MNRIVSFTIILFCFVIQDLTAQKQPKFFIVCAAQGDTASKYAGAYERVMAYYLQKAFPCARTRTQGDITTRIGRERVNQLLGGETDWGSFCDDLACDYLINLELSDFLSNQVVVSASCIWFKKAEPLVRDAKYGPRNYASIKKLANEVAENIAKKMEEYEVCPYTGNVNIEVKSNREENATSSTQCDAGLITTDIEIKSNSTLKWELQKKARREASGTATYDLKENYKTTISNSCYVCEDGTKGFAKIIETQDSEAKVQGLSNESVSEGAKVSDARIKIVFLDDGTYFLQVKATSKKGPMKVTTEKKVDGPCTSSNENEPPDTKNKSIDVPITAVFGPYKGTAEDKVLSQNETKDVSNGKEQTTVTIDFTLTRN